MFASIAIFGAPILHPGGDKDLIKIENAVHINQLIAGSQLCILPGTTHFSLSKNPELVLGIVSRFLLRIPTNVSELSY